MSRVQYWMVDASFAQLLSCWELSAAFSLLSSVCDRLKAVLFVYFSLTEMFVGLCLEKMMHRDFEAICNIFYNFLEKAYYSVAHSASSFSRKSHCSPHRLYPLVWAFYAKLDIAYWETFEQLCKLLTNMASLMLFAIWCWIINTLVNKEFCYCNI